MFAYVIRRMFSGLIMLVVMSFVTFLLFFNGAVDPVRFTCGKACTPTVLETNRKTLGFDDPVPVQYGKFVKGIFVGRNYPDDPELAKTSPETIARCDAPCLGYSPQQSATVTSVIGDKIPVSVSLAIAAFILWIVFGVLFGVIAALNKGKFLDKLLVGGSLLFFAFPTFWIGSFAYRFIAVRWELLPVPEYVSIADGGVGAWALGLFLPALTLALFYMAGYVRITRAYVLESMSEDYLRTAKAKGLQPHHTVGEPLLSVRDLKVHFPTDDGLVKSVDGLSYDLAQGGTIGIVGESGSGKSVSSQAIMGLHRGTRAQLSGEIIFDGKDLLTIGDEELRQLRGRDIAMVFQDPLSALHPYYTVGNQIMEAYRVHHDVSKKAARTRTIEMLDRVGIPNASARVDQYPHEFSGGMRQRAMIAMALINDPRLIIADEPTTALDVTVQAQILDLLRDLQKEFGSSIIIITHDLGVVAEMAEHILVMYGGRAVERGSVDNIFYAPEHPYAWGLLSSMPRMDRVREERLRPIAGNPPSLINPPAGCVFNPRCPYVDEARLGCVSKPPAFDESSPHPVRCHIPHETRREIFQTKVKPTL